MAKIRIVESMAVRLAKALSLRNMKQNELAKITGISKSSINQYISGYATNPNSDRIFLMAKALDVDPVWLMGLDVPMEKPKAEPTKENADAVVEILKDARMMEYIKKINSLSAEKKETLYSYIDFLISTN